MIQCETYPGHRCGSAMCHIGKNLIILYGGYHGGLKHEDYGDLWLLDLTNCKETNRKLKSCAMCGRTNHECKLYQCGNCQSAMYCSLSCQKRDWLEHKVKCEMKKS